jgi:cytochrome oxidase Cu insertion factor (SCO1/SenC/PrrC family)/thiol-disulfide isomerase/thioredoxin
VIRGSGAVRCALALLVVLVALLPASVARADGDPGSDVLVYQPLFLGSDAGVSISQQSRLGGLLRSAARAGFPVRVAIISSRNDLGAVTGLWRQPRNYARLLGVEVSLAYKGRLLVVMPNGVGFNWSGHPSADAYRTLAKVAIKPGAGGLATTAEIAVRSLAAAAGVTLSAPAGGSGSGSGSAAPGSAAPGSAAPGSAASGSAASGSAASGSAASGSAASGSAAPGSGSTASGSPGNDSVLIFLGVVVALVAAGVGVRYALRRRRRAVPVVPASRNEPRRGAAPNRALRVGIPVAASLAIAAAVPIVAFGVLASPKTTRIDALASNPELDSGTPLRGRAPDFTLSDQFGKQVSLRSFRGKVVVLAFNDSECTTVCPLTTSAMVQAKAMLGSAGKQVQLLGVDANPKATSLEGVLAYSEVHGMLHQWRFLTGSRAQLKAVWKAYSIGVEISQRQVDHSPAVFVIDPRGRFAKLYLTQQSYAAVGQFGRVLAGQISSLLPDHPRVGSNVSYSRIAGIGPTASVDLPRAGGGSVALGPGGSPRLMLFFATWDREVTSLAGQLQRLDDYQASAGRSRLPPLTAVDEGSVEPSAAALPAFLSGLRRGLSYPVAVDRDGRVADGYEVQGQPWFVLTSAKGQILWYWEVSSSGWLGPQQLADHVRAALSRAPKAPAGARATQRALLGSPAPLAALHQHPSRLLGSTDALTRRLGALKGYPVVINVWASWCTPCRSEFGLFGDASARYGRKVAFLGADTNDSAGDAQSFLGQHPVSYPSYQATLGDVRSLAVVQGLPTTIFIDSKGRVAFVHTGQYDSQGSLDSDIETYAK